MTSNGLGLTRKEAEDQLSTLQKLYLDTMGKLIKIRKGELLESYVGETQILETKSSDLSKQIGEIREWYSISIFESIERYSRELRWLTVGLMTLTAVLAILTADLLWRFL